MNQIWNNAEKKKNKYRNKKVSYMGTNFDSKLERMCYFLLQDMKEKGKILNFKYQVTIPLFMKYKHIVDFRITKRDMSTVYLEAKGRDLQLGKLKRHLAEWIHKIQIHVIKRPAEIEEVLNGKCN